MREGRVALAVALWLALGAAPGWAGEDAAEDPGAPDLGQVPSAEELARWDTSIYPDGTGLPPGRGSVAEGREVWLAHCAACHGAEGEGGSAPEIAGGREPLDAEYPDQNIGTYWPWATTVFDFTRRAMPLHAPGSLSDDQVYAVTAWMLHANGLLPADAVLDAATLAAVRMPNRDGFDSLWPDRGPPTP